MPRQISYRWRLRELMAARGITLSSSQVHRLVSGTPERQARSDNGRCPCSQAR
ncbi:MULTISPECIES: hypothetical protein [Streptomyces]|uniref:hypothetical protein n=1 Tax=Streptomyces TaxID=1883 RepID=UPI00339A0DEE